MVDQPAVIWMQTADGTMAHLIEPVEGRAAGFHNAFEVADFDATVAALRERDLEFTGGPGERHDGQRFAIVLDPDGTRTEFTTPSVETAGRGSARVVLQVSNRRSYGIEIQVVARDEHMKQRARSIASRATSFGFLQARDHRFRRNRVEQRRKLARERSTVCGMIQGAEVLFHGTLRPTGV